MMRKDNFIAFTIFFIGILILLFIHISLLPFIEVQDSGFITNLSDISGLYTDIKKTSNGEIPGKDFSTLWGPMTYYYSAVFIKLFGQDVQSIRLGITLIGLINLILFFQIMTMFTNRIIASVFSVFTIPFNTHLLLHFYLPYSQYLAVTFTLITILLVQQYIKKNKSIFLFFIGIAIGLTFFTKISFAFIQVTAIIFFLILVKTRIKRIFIYCSATLCFFLIVLILKRQFNFQIFMTILLPVILIVFLFIYLDFKKFKLIINQENNNPTKEFGRYCFIILGFTSVFIVILIFYVSVWNFKNALNYLIPIFNINDIQAFFFSFKRLYSFRFYPISQELIVISFFCLNYLFFILYEKYKTRIISNYNDLKNNSLLRRKAIFIFTMLFVIILIIMLIAIKNLNFSEAAFLNMYINVFYLRLPIYLYLFFIISLTTLIHIYLRQRKTNNKNKIITIQNEPLNLMFFYCSIICLLVMSLYPNIDYPHILWILQFYMIPPIYFIFLYMKNEIHTGIFQRVILTVSSTCIILICTLSLCKDFYNISNYQTKLNKGELFKLMNRDFTLYIRKDVALSYQNLASHVKLNTSVKEEILFFGSNPLVYLITERKITFKKTNLWAGMLSRKEEFELIHHIQDKRIRYIVVYTKDLGDPQMCYKVIKKAYPIAARYIEANFTKRKDFGNGIELLYP